MENETTKSERKSYRALFDWLAIGLGSVLFAFLIIAGSIEDDISLDVLATMYYIFIFAMVAIAAFTLFAFSRGSFSSMRSIVVYIFALTWSVSSAFMILIQEETKPESAWIDYFALVAGFILLSALIYLTVKRARSDFRNLAEKREGEPTDEIKALLEETEEKQRKRNRVLIPAVCLLTLLGIILIMVPAFFQWDAIWRILFSLGFGVAYIFVLVLIMFFAVRKGKEETVSDAYVSSVRKIFGISFIAVVVPGVDRILPISICEDSEYYWGQKVRVRRNVLNPRHCTLAEEEAAN